MRPGHGVLQIRGEITLEGPTLPTLPRRRLSLQSAMSAACAAGRRTVPPGDRAGTAEGDAAVCRQALAASGRGSLALL